MAKRVHGHEVMRMMIETGDVYTRETLRSAIHTRFGESTRFHTCSAENMTADELIEFLEAKGKFLSEESGFTTHADKMCDHE